MVTIESGTTSVQVLPEEGALITRYRTVGSSEEIDWLLPRSRKYAGSFVMVPFTSRIAGGQFQFRGERFEIKPNVAGESYPIHGFAWQRSWQVVEQSESSVILRCVEDAGDWPWSYRADLELALEDRNLTLRLDVMNDSQQAMPVGIGFHPYFASTPLCHVDALVNHQWYLDEALIPTHKEAINIDRWHPAREQLDNVYSGWQQKAQLVWPERRAELAMTASECFEHFVIYSEDESFCAEPVSNMVDGFNMMARGEQGHGVTVLESGGRMSGWVKFEPLLW